MFSLSLVHWLLLGNCSMLIMVSIFLWMLRQQNIREGQGQQQQIAQLRQTQSSINQSSIGLGRRIKQLESRIQTAEHHAVVPDMEEAKFAQASRLVGMGASATDLVDSCGVARGEAELLVSMRRRAS